MSLPPVSRREFIIAGGALLAGASVPAWGDIFPQGQSVDDLRTESADAAL